MQPIDRNDTIDSAYVRLVALAVVAIAATVFSKDGPAIVIVALAGAAKARFVVYDFLERRHRRDVLTSALLLWPVFFLLCGAVVAVVAAHR